MHKVIDALRFAAWVLIVVLHVVTFCSRPALAQCTTGSCARPGAAVIVPGPAPVAPPQIVYLVQVGQVERGGLVHGVGRFAVGTVHFAGRVAFAPVRFAGRVLFGGCR